jgi:hypothetical protein
MPTSLTSSVCHSPAGLPKFQGGGPKSSLIAGARRPVTFRQGFFSARHPAFENPRAAAIAMSGTNMDAKVRVNFLSSKWKAYIDRAWLCFVRAP